MNSFTTILFLLLFSLTSRLFAFDLVTAYKHALTYNADYLSATYQNKIDDLAKSQEMEPLLPHINGNASYTYNYNGNSNGYLIGNQPSVGINLQQVIINFADFIGYDLATLQEKIADITLLKAKQNLVINVITTYLTVLNKKDLLLAAIKNENFFLEQYQYTQKAFHAGEKTLIDVNSTKADYDLAHLQTLQAMNNLKQEEYFFTQLTGLDPSNIQTIVDNIHIPFTIENQEYWYSEAEKKNLDIMISHMNALINHKMIFLKKSEYLPTLGLSAAYSYAWKYKVNKNTYPNHSVSEFNGSTGSIGLNLDIPIYNGGTVNTDIEKADFTADLSQEQFIATKRLTMTNIQQDFLLVSTGDSQMEASKQALSSADIKLKSSQIAYKAGTISILDLTNAENNYIAQLSNYNNERYTYILNQLNLMKDSGNITDDVLEKLNTNIVKN